jgi:hypothetical protein
MNNSITTDPQLALPSMSDVQSHNAEARREADAHATAVTHPRCGKQYADGITHRGICDDGGNLLHNK